MRFCFAALLAWLALTSAGAAGAAGVAARLHSPAGLVRAGERLELAWRDLPAGTREVELELSLDGGRWIRISPELDALEGAWRWEVPNVACESARLRLRCGGDHREEIAAVTAPFGIASVPTLASRRDFLGEWWPELDDSAPRGARPGSLESGEPAYSQAEHRTHAQVSTAPTLHAPADDGQPLHERPVLIGVAARPPARSARPAFVPMRN